MGCNYGVEVYSALLYDDHSSSHISLEYAFCHFQVAPGYLCSKPLVVLNWFFKTVTTTTYLIKLECMLSVRQSRDIKTLPIIHLQYILHSSTSEYSWQCTLPRNCFLIHEWLKWVIDNRCTFRSSMVINPSPVLSNFLKACKMIFLRVSEIGGWKS